MKKLIYLATFMFLCSNVFAGWSPAWPSTDNSRFTNTNDWVLVSNLVAQTVSYSFTVTSSIAIPGWSTNGYIYTSAEPDGWLGRAGGEGSVVPWRIDEGAPLSSTVIPTMGVQSNYASVSNYFSISNSFNAHVYAGDQIFATGVNTNWIPVPAGGTPIGASGTSAQTNTFQIITDVSTNDITEIFFYSWTNGFIDMTLNANELRVYDTYNAIKERRKATRVAQIIPIDLYPFRIARPKYGNYDFGPTYSTSNYLHDIKSIVEVLFDNAEWVNTNLYVDGNLQDWMISNNKTNLTDDVLLTKSNLLTLVGAPTNYFEFTPARQQNGTGLPYGRLVTNSWTLYGTTDPVTNNTYDYLGNPVELIGTNGQVVTSVVTNDLIQEGFTELDYGWKFMQDIINEMTQVRTDINYQRTGAGEFNYRKDKYDNRPYTDLTWAAAKISATNEFTGIGDPSGGSFPVNTEQSIYGTMGLWVNTNTFPLYAWGHPYAAIKYMTETKLYAEPANTSSEVAAIGHFYVQGGGLALNIFDDQGYSQLSNNVTTFWGSSDYVTNSNRVYASTNIGSTNTVPTWCDDPTSTPPTDFSSTYKGFTIKTDNSVYGGAVLEWDFNYK